MTTAETTDLVNERPILFSGPMVRAIRAGRKTQTRRVMNPQPTSNGRGQRGVEFMGGTWFRIWSDPLGKSTDIHTPYEVGGNLWVRETFMPMPHLNAGAYYRADDPLVGGQWKPSIFMPRALSRITLEITDVRVQRLQEISNGDAFSEGVGSAMDRVPTALNYAGKWINLYGEFWDSLNAKRGFGWATNPWVWAVTFVVHPLPPNSPGHARAEPTLP
jgi:hypothetical protein